MKKKQKNHILLHYVDRLLLLSLLLFTPLEFLTSAFTDGLS